jgi:transcriptional regulator with XRE-family HTH domain
MDDSSLAKALALLRKNKKISQQTMAKDLNISRATISNFENGTGADIGLKKVLRMMDYLGYEFAMKEKSSFPAVEEILT